MKKIFSLVLAASLLVLFGCTKNGGTPTDTTMSGEQTTTQTQTYESKVGQFSLQFPSDRTFQENVYGSLVMFFSPMTPGDTLKENVGVIKETLTKETTLDEYYTLTKPQLEQAIPNFQEVSNEPIKVNGIDAKKLIYKGTQGEVKLQWQQVYLIKGTTAYIITYTAAESTFDDFIKQVNAMIETFVTN